jgi:hypothetical protein
MLIYYGNILLHDTTNHEVLLSKRLDHDVSQKTKYTLPRHWFYLKIFRTIFGPFFKWYYRFKAPKIKIKESGPYLILANHTSEFDIIFMDMLFDAPLYFVASDQLLNSGKGSWFLKYFFNPIPKSKSMADLTVVKKMLQVIKEKGNIAIYPEGNATMHGGQLYMPEAIAKLIKFLNIPVMFLNIHGLYLSSPRWSYHRKFGPSTIEQKSVYTPDFFASMNDGEVYDFVKKELDTKLFVAPQTTVYRGKNRAEGLHKLIFMCPTCDQGITMYSQGHELRCNACDFKGYYDEYGYVVIGGKQYDLPRLDLENKTRFSKYILKNYLTLSLQEDTLYSIWLPGVPKRSKFVQAKFFLDHQCLTVKTDQETKSYPISTILSMAIQVRTKLIVYLNDGSVLLFKFPRHVSPYQYLITLQLLTMINLKGGNIDDIHIEPTTLGL